VPDASFQVCHFAEPKKEHNRWQHVLTSFPRQKIVLFEIFPGVETFGVVESLTNLG